MSQHIESVRRYVIIFAALMFLLIVTIVAAAFDFGAIGLTIALVIAFIKALMVVLYFMHVRYASKLVWIFASAAFLWLGIMLALTFADYLTRPGVYDASTPAPYTVAQNSAPAE